MKFSILTTLTLLIFFSFFSMVHRLVMQTQPASAPRQNIAIAWSSR